MRYTDSTAVASILKIAWGSPYPTAAEVTTIASYVSGYINRTTGRIWTTATYSEYLDVWDEFRQSSYGAGRLNMDSETVFQLKHYPVVSLTFVRENSSDLGAAASWVTRATGVGGDVLLYQDEGVISFHENVPYSGRHRLWVSYTYGTSPVPDDIQYAATLLVAEQALTMISRTDNFEGLSAFSGGEVSYTFGELELQRKRFREMADNILRARGYAVKGVSR